MRIPKQVTFFTKKLLFIEKLNSKKMLGIHQEVNHRGAEAATEWCSLKIAAPKSSKF